MYQLTFSANEHEVVFVSQSFPISTVGGEQLRSTAQSDTAASPSREFFGTRQHDIRANQT